MMRTILFGAVGLLAPDLASGKVAETKMPELDTEKPVGHRVPLQMKRSSYNKFEQSIDKTKSFKPKKRLTTQLSEWIWGKDERTLKFESAVADY